METADGGIARLGIGQHDLEPANPVVSVGLSVLVGVAVFAVLWKMRKTFGMKE